MLAASVPRPIRVQPSLAPLVPLPPGQARLPGVLTHKQTSLLPLRISLLPSHPHPPPPTQPAHTPMRWRLRLSPDTRTLTQKGRPKPKPQSAVRPRDQSYQRGPQHVAPRCTFFRCYRLAPRVSSVPPFSVVFVVESCVTHMLVYCHLFRLHPRWACKCALDCTRGTL